MRRSEAVALAVLAAPVLVAAPRARGSSPDKEVVRREVRKHLPAIGRCYALVDGRPPQGRLAVRFVIARTGRVRSAERDASSTLEATAVEACVLSEVRRFRLPPRADGGEITVTYPFEIDFGS
jgi:hypothetical protein